MDKKSKIFIGIVVLAVLVAIFVRQTDKSPVDELEETEEIEELEETEESEEIEDDLEEEDMFEADYINYQGIIKSVEEGDELIDILVESEDDELIFHVSDDVRVLDMQDTKENKRIHLEEGARVKVVFHKDTPMAMSLPGQVTPLVVIVLNGEEDSQETVFVDRFDDELVSSDNSLKLNIEEDAEDYKGKVLAVYYDMSTKSIPAQTNPIKIIIIEE